MNAGATILRQQPGLLTVAQALALAALAILYAPHVYTMAGNWWIDPNYSHGFLVPIISGYLIWRRREFLARSDPRPTAWGLAVIAAGLMILIMGQAAHEFFLKRFSLIPVLWGLVLLYWGWPLARRVWFAFAYLVLMIPLPYVIYDSVAFPLRLIAASMAGWTLRGIGMPVLVEGNVIHLPATVMNVVDACSGIRSLISLVAVGAVLAYLMLPKRWLKVAAVLLVLPVAVLTNSLRVVAAGLLAETVGPWVLEGAMHDFTGWLVFMVAFAIMAGLIWLMRRLSTPEGADA